MDISKIYGWVSVIVEPGYGDVAKQARFKVQASTKAKWRDVQGVYRYTIDLVDADYPEAYNSTREGCLVEFTVDEDMALGLELVNALRDEYTAVGAIVGEVEVIPAEDMTPSDQIRCDRLEGLLDSLSGI